MERQLGLPDDSGLMFAARITFAHGSLRRGQERVMTKKMLLAGVAVAALSVVSATAAAAQAPRAGVTVLQNEPGGYLAIYQYRFETLAANGDSAANAYRPVHWCWHTFRGNGFASTKLLGSAFIMRR